MIETTPATNVSTRYRQLDSLRGVAALFVFFSHFFLIFKIDGSLTLSLEARPLGVLINGHSAVMFFFVLSGFVLSLPFISNEKPLNLAEFYIKRVFRIYPAYILAILLAIVLKTFVFDKHGTEHFTEWVRNFWLWDWNKQNYHEIIKTFLLIGPNFNADLIDPVIWSLVTEMKMSLLLPFFIVIVSRSNVFFNLLFFLITIGLIYNHQAGYLSVFYLGILLAKYKDYLTAKFRSVSIALVIAAMIFSLFLYNINFEFFKPYGDFTHVFGYFWRDMASAIGSCILIIIAISRKRIANILETRFFIFAGDISYSFYLIHLPILITICSFFSSRSAISNIYIFLSVIILAFVISYILFQFIEKPFQAYAKKLVKRKFIKVINYKI